MSFKRMLNTVHKKISYSWLSLYGAFFAYVICITYFIFHHVPWRDEVQAWLIARDTTSFFSLFHLTSYEGNMMLWHALLYPLAHMGLPILSMQILNGFFVLMAAYIILRNAPFPILMRVGIIFGYFFIFEYSIIARNYGISMGIIFLLACLYKDRFKLHGWYMFFLLLLSCTNVHSWIISCILFILFIYEAKIQKILSNKRIIFYSIIFLLIFTAEVAMLKPQSDLWNYTAYNHYEMTLDHFINTVIAINHAFIPIPLFKVPFWNTFVMDTIPFNSLVTFEILFISCIPFLGKRNKKYLISYLGIVALMLGLFFIKHDHSARHDGFIYIAWLFLLWISYGKRNTLRYKTIIGVILIAQLCAGAVGLYYAARYTFSNSYAMSVVLHKKLKNYPVLSYSTVNDSAILAYMNKNYRLYCLEIPGPCSYIVWTKNFDDRGSKKIIPRLKKNISNFQKNTNYSPHYLLVDDSKFLKMSGLEDSYSLVSRIGGKCITTTCSFYLYFYKGMGTTTSTSTPSIDKPE